MYKNTWISQDSESRKEAERAEMRQRGHFDEEEELTDQARQEAVISGQLVWCCGAARRTEKSGPGWMEQFCELTTGVTWQYYCTSVS